jgi:hypothetical protein
MLASKSWTQVYEKAYTLQSIFSLISFEPRPYITKNDEETVSKRPSDLSEVMLLGRFKKTLLKPDLTYPSSSL